MLQVNRRPGGAARRRSRAGQLGVGAGPAVAGVLAGAGVRLGVAGVWLGDVLPGPEGLAVREGAGDAGAVGAGDGGAAGAVGAGAGLPAGWTVAAGTGRTRM
jgi:hypothetical protein